MHSCWIEISRSALRHNFEVVQKHVGGETRLICVIKADAYGCGAVECARVFESVGATYFAVTRLEEALPLREAGIENPILLLSPVVGDEEAVLRHDLTACLSCPEDAERLAKAAERLGVRGKGHVKVDAGMGRFGMTPEELTVSLSTKLWPENLEYEGIFAHFSDAGGADEMRTTSQRAAFKKAVEVWSLWRTPALVHCANSAYLVRYPSEFSAARPGTVLYGQFPTPAVAAAGKAEGVELRDVFQAKARVVALRRVKQGTPIGYGSEWTAAKDSTIAILACGYADGLALEPRARTESPFGAVKAGFERAARLWKNPRAGRLVTVRGQKTPIVGRIAMQTCAVDVTGVSGVELEDEVVVPMRRVTSGGHLPRVYVD